MEKKEQILEILLMPIFCDKKYDGISRKNNAIQTGQEYYSNPDEDMSDFAIGFYEIIYKNILSYKQILNDNGYLLNKEVAGDTMNSFNYIAYRILGAGKCYGVDNEDRKCWPEFLQNYYSQYHCLANFWLLPMDIGRTLRGNLNKSTRAKDYMDRFLRIVLSEIKFDGFDRDYFRSFKCWSDFTDKHFITQSYLNQKLEIELYSDCGNEYFVENAIDKIRQRAECIAQSEYADELLKYFSDHQLL